MSLEDQIAQTVDPTVFTRLCNSLLNAEYGHKYQVIDGTVGDEGNDGWLDSERRVFAIYCPVKPDRRTSADYRDKAFSDLMKAAGLRDKQRFPVERWTFVTPRKLSNEVIVSIRKRGEELRLEVNHVEATYLSGLLLKHPELIRDFPDFHISQIEELLKRVLESPEVKQPKPSPKPEFDFFSHINIKRSAEKDAGLHEVYVLRESPDRAVGKRGLRALIYRTTDPVVHVNAVIGLADFFDPMTDDVADLVSLCNSGISAAQRINSKSVEAYLLAQKGFYQSLEFGRLLIERYGNTMSEQAIGMSLEEPAAVAQRQARLGQLAKGYADSYESALKIAHEARSGPALAAVLILMGNAAGQRAIVLSNIGPKAGFENERDVCKRALLAAKDIYVHLADEHGVANAQFNLANQIRFFGEVEEAKELVKAVIPVAEKFGDDDMRRKAELLEERLRTGTILDYMASNQ